MGPGQLENTSNSSNSCDVLDARRLQQALGHFAKGNRYQAFRRFSVGLLVSWCISATVLAAIAQYTVNETRIVLEQTRAKLELLEAKQTRIVNANE